MTVFRGMYTRVRSLKYEIININEKQGLSLSLIFLKTWMIHYFQNIFRITINRLSHQLTVTYRFSNWRSLRGRMSEADDLGMCLRLERNWLEGWSTRNCWIVDWSWSNAGSHLIAAFSSASLGGDSGFWASVDCGVEEITSLMLVLLSSGSRFKSMYFTLIE